MPIRRPELDHEALFTAHRRTRHLNAIAETEVEAPSPASSVPDDDALTSDALQKTSAGRAPSPDAAGATQAAAGAATEDRPQPRRRRRLTSAASAAADGMMTIKKVVPYPAPGISPALDALAAEIGEGAAVRSLLRRAFDDFRQTLEAGEMPEALPTYEEIGRAVATTRRIPRRTHGTAVQHLDPARLLSNRALARLLARRALAHFFEAERQKAPRRA